MIVIEKDEKKPGQHVKWPGYVSKKDEKIAEAIKRADRSAQSKYGHKKILSHRKMCNLLFDFIALTILSKHGENSCYGISKYTKQKFGKAISQSIVYTTIVVMRNHGLVKETKTIIREGRFSRMYAITGMGLKRLNEWKQMLWEVTNF